MSDSQTPYDVLIVGAGPVGLAMAIGLLERGVKKLVVIDQTREFRRVGQFIDLLPNGLKALRAIAESAYQSTGIPPLDSETNPGAKRVWYRKNLQGVVTRTTSLAFEDWQKSYGEGRISLPWFTLQTNLRNLIDPSLIQINYRCCDYEQTPEAVTVYGTPHRNSPRNPFAHWEIGPATATSAKHQDFPDSPTPIRAKLVIAADGINSTLRRVLYHNSPLEPWTKPQYSGWSAMGCLTVNAVPEDIVEQLTKDYFQDQRLVSLQNDALMAANPAQDSPRLVLFNQGGGNLGYLLHLPLPLEKVLHQPPIALLNLAIKELEQADFPAVITDLLCLTDLEQFFSRPYYLHPANPCDQFPLWSQNRLVLAGDAAHGMPPFNAQGANQGFEDAAYLVQAIATLVKQNQLDDLGAINHQFQGYERHRRPFVELIQKAALENHRWTDTEWETYNQQVYGRQI